MNEDIKRAFEHAEDFKKKAKETGMPQEMLNQMNQMDITATINAVVEILMRKKVISKTEFLKVKRKHQQLIMDYNNMDIELKGGK